MSPRALAPAVPALAVLAAAILAASACGPAGRKPDDAALSPFAEDTPLSGRVVQNGTACVVDGRCYLRIEFADTTIDAVYGLGDIATRPCEIPREVSDVAFRIEPGERVTATLSGCGEEGHYLRELAAGEGDAPS